MSPSDKLISLYQRDSKHSNYQLLPGALKAIVKQSDIVTNTRYESERLEYISNKIDFKDKKVLDIGGNTGYFTFELIDKGVREVCHYEGNKNHSEFVSTAAEVLKISEKVKTVNKYYNFDPNGEKYDVVLLFNVLHHLGDDYGNKEFDITKAKEVMIEQLNNMANITDTLVLQIGFNWQGNKTNPLFSKGTKSEMIEFIKDGIKGHWNIEHIGIAEKLDGNIIYNELTSDNIARNDELGEFLNRPIFILKNE